MFSRLKQLILAILLLIVVSVLSLCAWINVSGYWTYGPFTGQVIDMDTGKPIEGAFVYFYAETYTMSGCAGEVPFFTGEFCQRDKIEINTLTDGNGNYYLPKKRIKSFERQNKRFADWAGEKGEGHFFVYKAGYVGYNNYNIFPCDEKRIDFKETGNIVKLEPWRNYYFHQHHLNFISNAYHSAKGADIIEPLIEWEHQASNKEYDKMDKFDEKKFGKKPWDGNYRGEQFKKWGDFYTQYRDLSCYNMRMRKENKKDEVY